MYDPTTGGVLGNGSAPIFTDVEIQDVVDRARAAQRVWAEVYF